MSDRDQGRDGGERTERREAGGERTERREFGGERREGGGERREFGGERRDRDQGSRGGGAQNPQLYVGGIGRDVRQSDVYSVFEKYGKIRDVTFKQRYAFVVSIKFILCLLTNFL